MSKTSKINSRTAHLIILAAIFIVSVVSLIWIAESSKALNGTHSFPFDDAWIHLQYAKNISTYGSYSYYKDEMVTSGSTSPLYTLIVSQLWNLSDDKYLLGYILGISFFCIAGILLYLIANNIFPGRHILAFGVVALFMLEPHLQYIALSGMETTLFIALLLLVWYSYLTQRTTILGMAGGLLIWCRPDGIIFLFIIFIEWIYRNGLLSRNYSQKGDKIEIISMRRLIMPACIILFLIAGYTVFNLTLSGTMLPNSFAAKGNYYHSFIPIYFQWTWELFSESSNYLMIACYLIGFVSIAYQLSLKKFDYSLTAVLWCVLLIICYWLYLPRLYQTGRYLLPVFPFILLIGIRGIDSILLLSGPFFKKAKRKKYAVVLTGVLMAAPLASEIISIRDIKESYCRHTRYALLRHIKTANWIRETLPADAVIASHDIGVLAYYSDRKIFDIMGLVTPSSIENVRNINKTFASLYRSGVSHFVTLRSWYDIDRRNPVYQTNDLFPDVMEVFRIDTAQFIFIPENCTILDYEVIEFFKKGDYSNAADASLRSIKQYPYSSRAYALFSIAASNLGDYTGAERAIIAGRSLNPDGYLVHTANGILAYKLKKYINAKEEMDKVISLNPNFPLSYQYLSSIYSESEHNVENSSYYKRKYDSLMTTGQ